MSAIPSVAMQHAIALSLGTSVVRSADLIDRVMEHAGMCPTQSTRPWDAG